MTVEDGIADVRLNRRDKMNALDPDMFRAIAAIGDQLRDDGRIRAVVLSREGRAFCAGLDLDRMTAAAQGESILPFADLGKRTHGIANWAQHLVWLWRDWPDRVRLPDSDLDFMFMFCSYAGLPNDWRPR